MNFPSHSFQRRSQNGSVVLIVFILLGIILVIVASNTTNLNRLKRELDLIEQKQLKRQNITAVPAPAALPRKQQENP